MGFKAGIIGAGGIAGMGILGLHEEDKIGEEKIEASHAGGYAATDEIELASIADVDAEKLDKFGQAWDIDPAHRYSSHQDMLERENLDVVSVCTPSYLHHPHVIDAASSSSAPDIIWCEKPIATSVAEAEEMIQTCEQNGTELVINHSFRFTDKQQKLRQLIQEKGILGDVKSVSTQFRMELLRNSTHLLDTLIYLLDVRADHVAGFINGENEAVDSLGAGVEVDDAGGGGFVVMDDGTFASIDCTIPRAPSSMTLNLIGTEGKLYLNNDDGEWRYWRLEDGEHIEEKLNGIDGAWTWESDYKGSFLNAANHLEDLLKGAARNHSPGRQAKRSLEIIVGFYISHYTGGRVTIPLQQPLRDVQISSW